MKKSGFTLLEIILTISLLIMISSIALYGFGFQENSCDAKVKKFVSDINYIRCLNLQGEKDASIYIDTEQNLYKIFTQDFTKTVELGKNMDIVQAGANINFLDSSWTKGNTIIINAGVKTYKITVAAITGRVMLQNN